VVYWKTNRFLPSEVVMSRFVYINGELIPLENAKVTVYDHGLLYGDGAFEGIRVYSGKIFKLRDHLARLYHSALALMINLPIAEEEMEQAVLNLCRTNGVVDGYIRVTITRGVGLGLDPRNVKNPTVIIMTDKLSLYPEEMYRDGLHVATVSTRITPAQSLEPRIKSLGKYLVNIQAKLEANRAGAGEGLMLNVEGFVAEGTGDNIFLVKAGSLITPPPYAGILEGITRNAVMDLARGMGIHVLESLFTLFDVYTADECFLTGTAAEVIPVVKVDGRTIGSGLPGEMTKRLEEAFRTLTKTEGVPF
jgi:branched-chain amino acid aminotransferase